MYIYIYPCVCVCRCKASHVFTAFLSWEVLTWILHSSYWPEVRFLHTGNCHVALHHPLQDAFREGLGKAMRWNHGWSFMANWPAIRLAGVCGVVLVGCVQQQGTLKSTLFYQLSSFPAKQMDTKKFFWDNGGKAIVSDCHWVLWPWIYPLVIPVFWWYQLTQFGGFFPHVLPFLDTQRYPLVNIQKTMDNHHFSWENPLFLWLFSIANC